VNAHRVLWNVINSAPSITTASLRRWRCTDFLVAGEEEAAEEGITLLSIKIHNIECK